MTEDSFYWAGSATGDCGPFTDDHFSDIWRKLFTNDRTTQGVLGNYLNELAVTNPSGVTIRQASGGAIVDGKFYESDANVDHTGVAPGSGSNFYRVVLRKAFSAQTVRSVLLGPNVATPDAVTQSDGTTWEISLATVEITSASAVTVTDTRDWVQPNIVKPDDSTLEYDGDGQLQVVDEGITATQIDNRTRTFLVPCVGGYSQTDVAVLEPDSSNARGYGMPDNKVTSGMGYFKVPTDFVSTLTASAIYVPGGTGNLYCQNSAEYGAVGEQYNAHTANTGGMAIEAVTSGEREVVDELSLSSAAAGDYVGLIAAREGTNAADTVNAGAFIFGWLVSYTADS